MVKYFEFPLYFFFCLKILFNVNGKAIVWRHSLFTLVWKSRLLFVCSWKRHVGVKFFLIRYLWRNWAGGFWWSFPTFLGFPGGSLTLLFFSLQIACKASERDNRTFRILNFILAEWTQKLKAVKIPDFFFQGWPWNLNLWAEDYIWSTLPIIKWKPGQNILGMVRILCSLETVCYIALFSACLD